MARILKLVAPRTLRYDVEPLSPPGAGEVHLRTRLGAISAGTEGAWYFGTDPQLDPHFRAGRVGHAQFPRTLGYEKVATVAAVGPKVDPALIGRRVVAYYGHADEWVLAANRVIPVPDGVSDEEAVACSLATVALHAVRRSRMQIGDDVFVAGQGFLGLLVTRIARLAGAGRLVVSDPFAKRREIALGYGADEALDPARQRPPDALAALGLADGLDVAFETSSAYEALVDAMAALRRNGRVCVVSQLKGAYPKHPVLSIEFHLGELEMISVDGRGDVRTLARWYFDAVRRRAMGDIAGLMTHRVPFDAIARGFELLETEPEDVVKILVTYEAT